MKRGYQIRKMGLYKGIIRNKEVSKQDEWRVCRVEEEASGMITNTKDLCKCRVDIYNGRSFLKCHGLAKGFL